jgi:hypothetical protein
MKWLKFNLIFFLNNVQLHLFPFENVKSFEFFLKYIIIQ